MTQKIADMLGWLFFKLCRVECDEEVLHSFDDWDEREKRDAA